MHVHLAGGVRTDWRRSASCPLGLPCTGCPTGRMRMATPPVSIKIIKKKKKQNSLVFVVAYPGAVVTSREATRIVCTLVHFLLRATHSRGHPTPRRQRQTSAAHRSRAAMLQSTAYDETRVDRNTSTRTAFVVRPRHLFSSLYVRVWPR